MPYCNSPGFQDVTAGAMEGSLSAQLTPKQRTDLAASMTTRMLSANVNSSYTLPRGKALSRPSETWGEYYPKSDAHGPVNKDVHLKKDDIKTYVEKALQLHDSRKGMPVVASPIWAPKQSSGKGH